MIFLTTLRLVMATLAEARDLERRMLARYPRLRQ
jgi:hypothetical protein